MCDNPTIKCKYCGEPIPELWQQYGELQRPMCQMCWLEPDTSEPLIINADIWAYDADRGYTNELDEGEE